MRWNNSSCEQAGSRSGSIGHPHSTVGQGVSSLSDPEVREEGGQMNHLGLPSSSASPCWVWLDVAPKSCTHPLPGPSPNEWCTSSGVGAAPCPPGHPYLPGPDQPPPPAQVRDAGGAGGAVGRLDEQPSDCRTEGRKASFLKKSMDRGHPPRQVTTFVEASQENQRPEKWAALIAAER